MPTTKRNITDTKDTNGTHFAYVLSTMQTIGNKKFCNIPVEFMFADSRFQRVDDTTPEKVKKLAANWSNEKMDPLRVSIHRESESFSVIDGLHRLTAAKLNGISFLACEVLDLSDDEEERLVREAKLFSQQDMDVSKLTPVQTHKANLILQVPENITVQKMMDKYGVALKKNTKGGKVKVGHLAGFSRALQIAKVGEDYLDYVFKVICLSGWNMAPNGFNRDVLIPVYNILKLHPRKEWGKIVDGLVNYFKPIEPEKFFAEGRIKYPERNLVEGLTLVLEDTIVTTKGIKRTYVGGPVKVA